MAAGLRSICLKAIMVFWAGMAYSQQNIGIGTAAPHASALLELQSTTKGLLLPRLSTVQRNQVVSPATGLLVYDVTTQTPWIYNGSSWQEVVNANQNNWVYNGSTLYNQNGGNVGVGTINATNRFQVGNIGNGENDFIVSFDGSFGMGSTSSVGRFFAKNDVLGYDSSLVFTRRGRLGIGNSNPLGRVQVQNDLLGFDSSLIFTEEGNLAIGTDFPLGRLHFRNDAIGVDSSFIVLRNGFTGIGTAVPLGPLHYVGDVQAGQDSNFMVNRAGWVGIGTNNPAGRLHIQSDLSGVDSVLLVSQAGHLGLGTLTPTARLQVENGSVLFGVAGQVPAANLHRALPASGEGRRTFWYPDKAAFRTGYVSGTQWNYDSIGTYTFAAGFNARAIGNSGSAAIGLNALALGINGSIALGSNVYALGSSSIAIGLHTQTRSASAGAIALGNNAASGGAGSIAAGYFATTEAGSEGSISLGNLTNAGGVGNVALGFNTEARLGVGAVAMGINTSSNGNAALAVGEQTQAVTKGSVTAGYLSTSLRGNYGMALGVGLRTNSFGGTVVGLYNEDSDAGNPTAIDNSNRIFQVGNGTSPASGFRRNAMTILQNGNVGIGVLNPDHNLVVRRDIRLDDMESNSGTMVGGMLRFGSNSTGEGIGSKRTEGGNQWGLDFYTGNTVRMSITNTGRLGIGTTNPFKGLVHIEGSVANLLSNYGFLNSSGNTGTAGGNNPYSLYASDRIAASEFNTHSDRRIKTGLQRSNSATDLQLINRIQITDYGFADHITRGNLRVKGLIAQELKEVLPSAVSTTGGFVPDIYCISTQNSFNESEHTLTIGICKSHGLKPGDRVQLLAGESRYEQTVARIVDEHTFVVSDWLPAIAGANPAQQVFVYGKYVPDFHSVDYNQVLATGISAIQQLAAQNERLEAAFNQALNRIEMLEKRVGVKQ